MSAKKQYQINSEKLQSLHYEQMLSPQEIADQIGCTRGLIYHYFRKFDIPKRPKNHNLEDKRFGKLTVKKFLKIDKNRQARWLCECDCGNTTIATTGKLNNGLQSCGCLSKDVNTTHGMSGTRPYRIWLGMKGRCSNPNHVSYQRYGARGISYCDRWNKFANFWNDMKDGYSPDETLHRLDNDDDYCPSNCIWASIKIQNHLKRNSVMLTYNGETMNATQWARRLDIPRHVIYGRRALGWNDEKILTTPYHPRT